MKQKKYRVPQPAGVVPGPRGTKLILFLSMLSGACGLAYEIIYVRIFSSYFGDGFLVTAVTLAALFLGISAGAWQSHRYLRYLAFIEITIGLYAFLIGGTIRTFGFDIVTAGGVSVYVSGLKIFVLLVIPAFLIGTCIPLFARYAQRDTDSAGGAFAAVYGLYNLGAFSAVVIIEFYLFRTVGLSLTAGLIGLANLAIGTTLLLTHASEKLSRSRIETEASLELKTTAALFIASFASGIFQLYVLRVSYSIFGPLHENFATILTSVILGVATGSLVSTRWKISMRMALLSCLAAILGFIWLLQPFIHTWSYLASLPADGGTQTVVKFLLLLLYPFPTFVALGTLVPVAVRVQPKQADGNAGRLLAVSSLANGLGSLFMLVVLYQYLSLPILGLLVAALFLLAAATVKLELPAPGPAVGAALLLIGIGFSAFTLWPATELALGYRTVSDHKQFRLRKADFKDSLEYKAFGQDASIISFKSGIRTLMLNGYLSLTFSRERKAELYEMIVGASPALFGKDAQSAMVFGLGSGVTGGATASIYPDTRIVEVNPAMFNIPPHFKEENGDLMNSSGATVALEDGILSLLATPQTYDAIVNTVTSPHYYSASKLYTAEFYDLVLSRLKPGGVYSSWFDLRIARDGVSIMLNTLEEKFAGCRYFLLSRGYFNVVCGKEQLTYQSTRVVEERTEGSHINRYLRRNGFSRDLAEIMGDLEMDFSNDFFSRTRTDLNHLDLPAIEFVVSRPADRTTAMEVLNDVVERNVEFRRKISFGAADLRQVCATIKQMSLLAPSGC